MADEVHQYIVSQIETLRSDVFRAGVLNAKALHESAETHLENILGCVTQSRELDEATFDTVESIDAFARRLYGHDEIVVIEQARRVALATIDALALSLEAICMVPRGIPVAAAAQDQARVE
jgi:vancomycin permeability regulator SanA